MFKRAIRLAAVAMAIAAAGCSGSDGAQGPAGSNGTDGTDGTNGTNGTNGTTSGKLSLTLDGVESVGTTTSTLIFTVRPAANVCPGGTCDGTLSVLGQKTFYAQEYTAANNNFVKAKNFSFNVIRFSRLTADGNGAVYTATRTGNSFVPESSASAFVYGYIATQGVVPVPTTGHYSLPSTVASAARVYGTIGYDSTANVAGCEKCHGAPYSKHGYRQARVAGLPDFVSCKACHYDDRVGSDAEWYMIADDPDMLVSVLAANGGVLTDALKAKYAYKATIMNDTHNSHAFEFNYPQKISNCVTCHEGKLNRILTDANFKPTTCKSCHPVTAVAGVESTLRAPAMKTIWAPLSYTHSNIDLYTNNAVDACNGCHRTGGSAPTFAAIHKGYNVQIYSDGNGTRFADSIKTTISAASYDAVANVGTVSFSVSGVSTTAAVITWSAYAGIYGFDTKDFIARQSVTVTPGANKAQFTGSINLASYASRIAAGQVKRIEVALMPTIAIDPTAAVSTTTGNLATAVGGIAQTMDVTQTSADARIADADSYGKKIVDPAKCNACHDALGTSNFHSPRNGSAGAVGCRVCHNVMSGAGWYEMQSRSLDSFIHAAHSMQQSEIDVVDLSNRVAMKRYQDKVEGNYPNFAGPLNCESCHYAGTYDMPAQGKSMPGVISASQLPAGGSRTLGVFAAEITGPGARACGGCHRAQKLNEQDGVGLAAFVAHTNDFSSNVDPTLSVTGTAAYLDSLIGTGPTAPAVAGAQVERCEICHPRSGSEHQQLFNTWKNGL